MLWVRIGVVAALAAFFGSFEHVTAQTSAEARLIQSSDLIYLGGFRVPREAIGGVDFNYGGRPIAFNPANNSLFVGNGNYVAEISIPTPALTSDAQLMPAATYVQQAFVEPTEGHLNQVSSSDVGIDGLLVHGNRLYGAASIYYDANNSQRVSHFARSLQLTQPSFSGWSQLWDATHQGFVGGWMSAVPPEWQAQLGGPAITGQCCIPIVWRTSMGPAAFAFDPAQIGQSAVAATPLLYYPNDHPSLGPWEGANSNYGATARVGGVAVIGGTRTALFIGSNGLGTFCYGPGTWDQSLVGRVPAEGGEAYCYDPTDSSKSQHAYPYRYQVWAYDLNDLAAVKAGSKRPWEVVPYAIWPLSFPTDASIVQIGGVGYDPQRQLLYVAQRDADRGQFTARPVIHVFRINAAAGAVTAPPVATSVNGIALSSDKTSPQGTATPITFTAQPTGGVAPYQYKWMISDGVTTSVAANWSASNNFVWTPGAANANYRVIVWVRSSGNAADAPEAMTSLPFAINAATPSTVALSANRVAPQQAFTAITWTAASTGGIAPPQYKWLVSDGSTTTVAANWSTSNTFTWTPAVPSPNYRVIVWMRGSGNTADAAEAMNSSAFAIEPPAAAAPATVSLTANKPEPQVAGTAITWTATLSAAKGAPLYKWFVSNGTTYSVVMDWSSSATFNWTPLVANANYRVAVWVKEADNTADVAEASTERGFSITAAAESIPPVVISPTPGSTEPVRSVTITSDKPSPQTAGSVTVFSAQAVGGTGPLQYWWWTFDNEQWTPVGSWNSSNTLTWSRPTAGSNYQIAVWVRSAGSTSERGEAETYVRFVLQP